MTRFNDVAFIAGDATAPRVENQLGGVVTLGVVRNALAGPNSCDWVLGVDETPGACASTPFRDAACARCSNGPS